MTSAEHRTETRSTGPRASFSHAAGFWVIGSAFLTAMAFSVVPTPLWPLYQQRDGFSTFMITVAFAAYAVGVLVSLFLAGHVSDQLGRRSVLLPAILLEAVSAVGFIVWNDLPGLIVARVISGLGIGMITATATAHILELHSRAHPQRDRSRADLVATGANLGGFAVGVLVSGILAEYVPLPLQTPYVVFVILLLVAAAAVVFVPETVIGSTQNHAYRPQRVRVPRSARAEYFAAAAVGFGALAVLGLFTSLAPVFIAGELGVTSRAIAGLVAFLVLGSAAVMQIFLRSARPSAQLLWGIVLLVAGLASTAISLFTASFMLFTLGGILAGGGAGVLFKSALVRGSSLAEPQHRGEALAGIFLAAYLGLAVPVLGLGLGTLTIAMNTALLGFSAIIIAIVLVGGIPLLRSGRS